MAVFSTNDLGINQTMKAPNLLMSPVITSALPANMLSTAILATTCGCIFTFSAVFNPFSPICARFAKSVSVEPGEIQVTDTEVFLNSCLSPLLKLNTKDLLAEYNDK